MRVLRDTARAQTTDTFSQRTNTRHEFMIMKPWQRYFFLSLCIGVYFFIPLKTVAATPATPPLSSDASSQISLAGQWQFYWGKLLSPADFAHPSKNMSANFT